MYDPSDWVCCIPGCNTRHKKNRWATSNAGKTGWFFQKDGSVYCPDHVPDWVAAWRANNAKN